MKDKHLQFRLTDDEFALVESIANNMGLSVGRAARHLALAGARMTAGIERPPVELLTSFQHDVEEFRATVEALNDSAIGGIESVRRDVESVDRLLVALLRGILQLVAMARMFGEAQDKSLVERALRSADQSVEAMLQKRREFAATYTTESHV